MGHADKHPAAKLIVAQIGMGSIGFRRWLVMDITLGLSAG
jgi:hypothetical protein